MRATICPSEKIIYIYIYIYTCNKSCVMSIRKDTHVIKAVTFT